MFETGVVSDGNLAVNAHGSQQNGAILGNGCAIFLCKFMTKLTMNYNAVAEEEGVDMYGPFDENVYKTALTNALRENSREDATEHGRLLALKKSLANMTSEKVLDEKQLACLYLKDIAEAQGQDLNEMDEDAITEMLDNLPDDEFKATIQKNRKDQSLLPDEEMFQVGSVPISDVLSNIKEAILKKDGIVEPEKQDLFREQVAGTLDERIIKSLTLRTELVRANSNINEECDLPDEDESETSTVGDEEDDETETKDEEGDDGEAEEEAREEEAQGGIEDAAEEEEEIDQKEVNKHWIKALNCNYPCYTYYKNLKKNLLIILNSERIATRKYPKWSENLFDTFMKLASCVPEISFIFQELGLNQENIMLSAMSL